jgi:type II restriction/modification system DNA methylase subunit YeeA
MTPRDFILKWRNHALTERAAAHAHFFDLCKLVGHPTPAEIDPKGEFYALEKGASKTSGGDGFADIWKKGFFAWEYKKRKRDLEAAMKQLADYSAALDNPPIHVACDTIKFRIETRWTNTVTKVWEFDLEDLMDDSRIALLRAVFHDPESLRPKQTRESLTREAAEKFQTISDRLQHRYADREAIAHFVNQLVFCFFANSVKLLPDGLLLKLLETSLKRPDRAEEFLNRLFTQMEKGGDFDLTDIRWFNGGLFDGRPALKLNIDELSLLRALHSFRWDLIDPTIFGTLFERFLDPDKRAQIGAHYTDPEKINLIIEPVILRPLRAEWAETKARIEALMRPLLDADGRASGHDKKLVAARTQATALRDAFIERLVNLTILDPACGSGNFLYLALQAVKDIEWRAILECEQLDLGRMMPRVGPRILHGIEINPLAAELARTVIWIGDIQWGIRNGLSRNTDPILENLDTIECRDALMTRVGEGASFETPLSVAPQDEGEKALHSPSAPHAEEAQGAVSKHAQQRSVTYTEAAWPEAEFIVGNPPFLGGKKLRRDLGDSAVEALFSVYDGRVPREADLVCYWFEKAWRQMQAGHVKRAGFVSTNSIRGGKNRDVLTPIAEAGQIFEAWADEPWVVDGAAVRVSLVCFGEDTQTRLDGAVVERVNADLSGGRLDLTQAKNLKSNRKIMRQGIKFGGPFEIDEHQATFLLLEPLNPNGRPYSDVINVWTNGDVVIDGKSLAWCIDFDPSTSENAASLYEATYRYLKDGYAIENAKRLADDKKMLRAGETRSLEKWWIHQRKRGGLQHDLGALRRYIGTIEVGKYRLLSFLDSRIIPSGSIYAIARDDDTTFGILHSRFHEAWSLRLGTFLGVGNDPRYTPTTTFETFPFPEGLTPNIPAADYAADPRAIRIAEAAKRLDELRRNWLYPADLGDWTPEIVPTAAPGEEPRKYPDRFIPKNVEAQVKLKERTLTKLYNQRPQWLASAHETLDRAVAAAYGWPDDISTDDALAELLALNLERAAAGR